MPTDTPSRTLALSSLSPHGFHRVSYYEWGDPANDRVVICVHGLSRNSRDFVLDTFLRRRLLSETKLRTEIIHLPWIFAAITR